MKRRKSPLPLVTVSSADWFRYYEPAATEHSTRERRRLFVQKTWCKRSCYITERWAKELLDALRVCNAASLFRVACQRALAREDPADAVREVLSAILLLGSRLAHAPKVEHGSLSPEASPSSAHLYKFVEVVQIVEAL